MPEVDEKSAHDAFPHGIGQPATRALEAAEITRLAQLTDLTEAERLRLHGVGPRAMRILRETLAATGRAFAEPKGR